MSPHRERFGYGRARMVVRHGDGVLLFDRRGEGVSEGNPNAFRALLQQTPNGRSTP